MPTQNGSTIAYFAFGSTAVRLATVGVIIIIIIDFVSVVAEICGQQLQHNCVHAIHRK
jgi:hypothetical protein